MTKFCHPHWCPQSHGVSWGQRHRERFQHGYRKLIGKSSTRKAQRCHPPAEGADPWNSCLDIFWLSTRKLDWCSGILNPTLASRQSYHSTVDRSRYEPHLEWSPNQQVCHHGRLHTRMEICQQAQLLPFLLVYFFLDSVEYQRFWFIFDKPIYLFSRLSAEDPMAQI